MSNGEIPPCEQEHDQNVERIALAENLIDDALDEAAEDEGTGVIPPRLMLVELAARCIARSVLEHDAPGDCTAAKRPLLPGEVSDEA